MSSSPIAAAALRAKGFTGKGVTVGVVDSGCDGTHPDLADHITHNVTLVSAEYVNQAPNDSNTLVVPIDQGPYNNTDLGSGHGTHVAGIIAADGTTSPDHLGVAPDAELACFAIGAVITTTAVVTAYDYMLRQPKMLGIDVINNSWGNSFRQYDPARPGQRRHQGRREAGRRRRLLGRQLRLRVRRGQRQPVQPGALGHLRRGRHDLDRQRGDFSSNGLEFDNGKAVPIGADGHTVLRGDRIGNTRPDIMAPGVKISSSCDTTGTVIGPCPPGENDSASGTSMSAPHIAGAAAVLVQANKRLSWAKVQRAMTATATPVVDADGNRLLSWTVGLRSRQPRQGRQAGHGQEVEEEAHQGRQAGRQARPARGRVGRAARRPVAGDGPDADPGRLLHRDPRGEGRPKASTRSRSPWSTRPRPPWRTLPTISPP